MIQIGGGLLLIVGLIFAATQLYPGSYVASGIGGAIGCAINMVIQWRYGLLGYKP